ncbi:MAG: MMPL family transporter [Pseudomonadales bacterium]|nr:MMPL family transporter [Pseudomonadales bacterium]
MSPQDSTHDTPLGRLLLLMTQRVQAQAWLVAPGFILASCLAAYLAITNLGVNTATNEMFSRNLDWFQQFVEFRDEFPILDRNVIVAIEGDLPEAVDRAQLALTERLQSNPDLFGQILALETSDFFLQNGLLFLSLEELEQLGERLAALQPITGRLNQQPNLAGFLSLLEDSIENDSTQSEDFDRALSEVTAVFQQSTNGEVGAISWQNLFSNNQDSDGSPFRRLIIVVPQLDFEGAEPRRRLLNGIREEAAALGYDEDSEISVRLTGGLALEQEELASVSEGIIQGAIATLMLVIVILLVTFRSAKLFFASLITLLCGLSITAAFTAISIGYINLISVAFVVLYIGLGIDFAIHYCLRYRELMAAGHSHANALPEASRDTGAALVLCAITSSVGFLAFVPTSFSGVAQLGLIAGFGMFASLFSTLLLLPALIMLFGPPGNALVQHTPPLFRVVGHFVEHHVISVRVAIAMLAIAVLWQANNAEFDSNPVNLRDPSSESVVAYRDLLNDSQTTPLTLSTLLSPGQLDTTAAELIAVPAVGELRSIRDIVPPQQQEKIAVLDDFVLFLGMPQMITLDETDTERDLAALQEIVPLLLGSENPNATELGRAIELWMQAPNADDQSVLLQQVSSAILDNLAFSWNRIVRGFQPQQFTAGDLPPDTQQLWIAEDGRQRLLIIATEPLLEMDEIGAFVEAVSTVAPTATGQPEIQYNAGRTVVAAFIQAISTAVIAVLILLLLLLRNVRQTFAVIIPLLLATASTAAIAALINQPFNFANVIALPLLIGVGVDNGIHMVKRHQHSSGSDGTLMTSSTARAILFSTITTIGSFGTLAFSNHPGTASMGVILAIGMTASLLAALFVVPAILPRKS